jgi:rubrerythrin
MSTSITDRMFNLMARHEGGMARYYRYLAKSFPEHEALFLDIASQETRHAAWVQRLAQGLGGQALGRSQTSFSLAALHVALGRVQESIDLASLGKLTLLQALDIALAFEKSPIERDFLDTISFHGPKSQQVEALMRMETEQHRGKLEDLRAKVLAAEHKKSQQ